MKGKRYSSEWVLHAVVRLVQLLVLVEKGEEAAGVSGGAPELQDKGGGVGFALEELEGNQILALCVRFEVPLEGAVVDERRGDILLD